MKIIPIKYHNGIHARIISSEIDTPDYTYYLGNYEKLSEEDPSVWDIVFKPANVFLATLSIDEAKAVSRFYERMWKLITQTAVSDPLVIKPIVTELLQAMDLPQQVVLFTMLQSGSLFPDLTAFLPYKLPDSDPANPKRSASHFYPDDYACLIAISLLSKLLCPIWGVLHVSLRFATNVIWETECYHIMTLLLDNTILAPTYKKLRRYIDGVVMHNLGMYDTIDLDTMFKNGYLAGQVCDDVLTTLIVKRYVMLDLALPNTDILAWTAVNATSICQSRIALVTKKPPPTITE